MPGATRNSAADVVGASQRLLDAGENTLLSDAPGGQRSADQYARRMLGPQRARTRDRAEVYMTEKSTAKLSAPCWVELNGLTARCASVQGPRCSQGLTRRAVSEFTFLIAAMCSGLVSGNGMINPTAALPWAA
jgi:hypothetical protein